MQATTTNDKPKRGDEAFERALCELVRERTGLTLQPHQLPNLRAGVEEGVRRFGHADADAWLRSLRACDGHGEELDCLVERITIGESYFFRDAVQMSFLRDAWLPALVQARRDGNRRVRVWSAGCSQGQEIYSIAILLRESLPDFDGWQVELLGTDICEAALADARRASYAEWSFRTTPAPTRMRSKSRRRSPRHS